MALIPLSQGKSALVDDEDFSRVSTRKWYFASGYAQTSIYQGYKKNPKTVQLHRFLLDDPKGVVDHVNHDPLDCRKENLRITDKAGNAQNSRKQVNNTTGYKGVNHSGVKYRAQIYLQGKNRHLGLFETALEAAKAYDKAALAHFGEYAHLNILENA